MPHGRWQRSGTCAGGWVGRAIGLSGDVQRPHPGCGTRAFSCSSKLWYTILRLQSIGRRPFDREARASQRGPREGRFKSQQFYMDRYWKEAYFEALDIFRIASEQAGLSMTQVALLWLLNHSLLKGQYRDGVILAASNLEQWETNLKNLSGELPQKVAEVIDQAWEKARPECPRYFRT